MVNHGTVRYPTSINPYDDVELLYNALEGLGDQFDTVTEIVGHRSLQQRLEIEKAFQQKYQKDLLQVLSSELTSDYEMLVKNLFRLPMNLLAHDLYKSMKGVGSTQRVMTNIICCCNNTEIHLLKKSYANYVSHRSLETDVRKNAKGPYGILLDEILKCERYEDTPEDIEMARKSSNISRLVDQRLVAKDVEDLYLASEDPKGKADPKVFINILTKRSKLHIKSLWEEYKKAHGVNLVQTIKGKFSEPLRTGLNTMIMAQVNLRLLLACQLYESMARLGTHESDLIRIICLHSECDLRDIADDYKECFGVDIRDAIKADTSGHFQKLLLVLLGDR
ncbi:Annexin [Paragonimus heterotremus]|uniref:Annexin n=1 Tax=Paragonimus heterotremus TaxID=100268 RepID=A0A8J4TF70_9TREM|nr:Annexin [Paragonimus heterotremus]